MGLVYGGGTIGLMGILARAVHRRGGKVHGVIPEALLKYETNGDSTPNVGETTVVKDMHTRKRLMGREASAFIAMAGGYGTLEELAEVVTWSQLGIHDRPVIVLNTNGFFDGLLQWIDMAVSQGFISAQNRQLIMEAKLAVDIPDLIRNYSPPAGRLNLGNAVKMETDLM